MKIKNLIKLESGQVSKIFIILAVAIVVVVAIIYVGVRLTSGINPDSGKENEQVEPKPVYETKIGNVRFLFESARNLGSTITSQTMYKETLKTTDKFIKVIVSAQNKSNNNTEEGYWNVGNIVDSAGRNFTPINERAYGFVPQPDLCGNQLKPEFRPKPCVKLYEVSKVSTNLKVEVMVGTGSKKQKALLDIIVSK